MVTVLTGAYGFLAKYVRTALEARGDVVAVGRPDLELSSAEAYRVLEAAQPDLLVHCAGPASVPASFADPAADFHANVVVTFDLLDRLRRLPRPPRIVFVSSAAIYGEVHRLPITELEEPRPVSPYGHHKFLCELLLRQFRDLYGLQSVSLRVFSAYGEGLRRQVIWDICAKALGEGEVRLHGTGAETRDFLHARDVAAAVVAVVDGGRFESEAYNVASGSETPIGELADLVVDALGVSRVVTFSGIGRRGDPTRWRADISRIAALGFRPSVELRDGVRAYSAWAARQLVRA